MGKASPRSGVVLAKLLFLLMSDSRTFGILPCFDFGAFSRSHAKRHKETYLATGRAALHLLLGCPFSRLLGVLDVSCRQDRK